MDQQESLGGTGTSDGSSRLPQVGLYSLLYNPLTAFFSGSVGSYK